MAVQTVFEMPARGPFLLNGLLVVELVAGLDDCPREFDVEIWLFDKDGTGVEPNRRRHPVEILDGDVIHSLIVRLSDVEFRVPSMYLFFVEAFGELLAMVPLFLREHGSVGRERSSKERSIRLIHAKASARSLRSRRLTRGAPPGRQR